MNKRELSKFFVGIVLPTILAILLFVITFFIFIIPNFRNNLLEGKKEMISELTNTALSLANEFYQEESLGRMTQTEAKEKAAYRIGQMRYGEKRKDYFWITDSQPVMIMHPYRPELNGTDLSDYQDKEGKKLFIEALNVVEEKGNGFIDYQWQWKDDTTLVVPKLSYVAEFEPWNWIIGTGIYLDDVEHEISLLQKRLVRIIILIIFVIASALLFVIRQSLIIEKRKFAAEKEMELSRQKYKLLVQSSTIGTLMVVNNAVEYANHKFLTLIGRSSEEAKSSGIESFFNLQWNAIDQANFEEGKSITFEAKVICNDIKQEVVLSVSKVKYNETMGYIIVVNELNKTSQIEKHKLQFKDDIHSTLIILNQSVKTLVKELFALDISASMKNAIDLMKRKKIKQVFVKSEKQQLIGLITESDIIGRFSWEAENDTVAKYMSSPLVSITDDYTISEAILKCRTCNVSVLPVYGIDNKLLGLVSYAQLLDIKQAYISQLFKQIDHSESLQELKNIYLRMLVVIEILIDSKIESRVVTRLISTLTDKLNVKVVEMALETIGAAPCEFCFVAMGSQGRNEQTLSTDQDNFIIYSDAVENTAEAQKYFTALGKKINDGLNTIGYRYCEGGFMAGNDQWVKSLPAWKTKFDDWIKSSDPESIIDVNIFFDFRVVYGSKEVGKELRNYVNRACSEKPVFFYQLAQEIIKHKMPLDIFGNITGDKALRGANLLNIKKLLLPVTSFARLYGLKVASEMVNTIDRIHDLKRENVINNEFELEIIQAYDILMSLRLKNQIKAILKGEEPTNHIVLSEISSIEKATLRKILSVLEEIMSKVRIENKVS